MGKNPSMTAEHRPQTSQIYTITDKTCVEDQVMRMRERVSGQLHINPARHGRHEGWR